MGASITNITRLCELKSELLHGNSYEKQRAREQLKGIATSHPDLTIANVAAKLARPIRALIPNPYGGNAA
jgi:hypothetical protein